MPKTINRLAFPEKFQLAEAIKHEYVSSGLSDAQFAEYFNNKNSFKVTTEQVRLVRYSLKLSDPISNEILSKRLNKIEAHVKKLLSIVSPGTEF